MFDRSVEQCLISAAREAEDRCHEYLCLEHLLYAIVESDDGVEMLTECGANVDRLHKKLEDFFVTKVESRINREASPQQTIAFQRVLQRAILHVKYSSKDRVSIGDILAAIFTETDSHAAYFLSQEGINRLDVLEHISHGDFDESFDSDDDLSGFEDDDEQISNSSDPLEKFTVNLNLLAQQNKLDPLIGREKELERAIHILCRRNKNNPLFVGDQGVGKTALAEGLALKIEAGDVPEQLKNLEIYSLDLGSMLAGTKYRGDFEKRIKNVIKALEKKKSAVLFIDEIHTIVGAGSTSGGSVDAANLLKPILTSGKLRCIGSTTYEEYKNNFEKDRALARRFLKIDVKEPSVEETIQILKGLKPSFEQHHKVTYSAAAIKSSAELSAKYMKDRFLPDKAIDVLDEAGAVVSLAAQAANSSDKNKAKVKTNHIEMVISSIAKIPTQTVSTNDKQKLVSLEGQLKQVVFGQDAAINELVRAIKRSRAGLGKESKPVGSFLFTGPTGVGKTEIVKQLSSSLGLELLRFDMSEYMEKHSVARLIGAPPGYVGFEQGGLLTDAVSRNPHSVLLLDEIEKAHPDIFNILLQVMDNAELTDNNGRRADFRNVIIVMTSNVGSDAMTGSPIGFNNDNVQVDQTAINKAFRPEFRNRLDKIIKFAPLAREVVGKIVDKFVTELDSQLNSKKVSVVISSEAREWIIENGFEAKYGGRSVQRVIQKEISDPLAEEVLFGKLMSGGTAKIVVKNDKLELEFQKANTSKSRKKSKAKVK